MGTRKTDDNVIIKMLDEGKTQKEIAEYFGVSPVAVHKRIKRLQVIEPPESFNNLTQKEQRFVIEKAKGNTSTQAVMNSYEVSSRQSAKVMGSQLMAKPEIRQGINDINSYMDEHGLTLSHIAKCLSNHTNNRDPNVSLRAIDVACKLRNLYPPQRNINLNANRILPVIDLSKVR